MSKSILELCIAGCLCLCLSACSFNSLIADKRNPQKTGGEYSARNDDRQNSAAPGMEQSNPPALNNSVSSESVSKPETRIVISPQIKIFTVPENSSKGVYKPVSVTGVRYPGMVFFDTDMHVLKGGSVAVVSDVVKRILENGPGTKVLILGHTDSVGTSRHNKRLSEERALSVMKEMHMEGVPYEIMSTIGIGELQPLASNDSQDGRAMNRRVEFLISTDATANRIVANKGAFDKDTAAVVEKAEPVHEEEVAALPEVGLHEDSGGRPVKVVVERTSPELAASVSADRPVKIIKARNIKIKVVRDR
ncbi:OmpA family protein [Maridesulfovibrio sp.]|uniref:OmpA family protein n=1 Tax=Maridesulfovibrio sp. TaxID=2795000 RepID=UPI002A189C71|nr:OmpA family protein [Maridesulfovibrio sp.]